MAGLNRYGELETAGYTCPRFSQPVAPDWKACPHCATRLSQEANSCRQCCSPVKPGWTACPECGRQIRWRRHGARGRAIHIEESEGPSKKPGGCFITTAVAESTNLPDDCHALEVMRHLRDTYMQETGNRREEVEDYYHIAPRIVAAISRHRDAGDEWHRIMSRWLVPILRSADEGDSATAHEMYRGMVMELKERWLRSSSEEGQ
jgi:hypothetical protein